MNEVGYLTPFSLSRVSRLGSESEYFWSYKDEREDARRLMVLLYRSGLETRVLLLSVHLVLLKSDLRDRIGVDLVVGGSTGHIYIHRLRSVLVVSRVNLVHFIYLHLTTYRDSKTTTTNVS